MREVFPDLAHRRSMSCFEFFVFVYIWRIIPSIDAILVYGISYIMWNCVNIHDPEFVGQ